MTATGRGRGGQVSLVGLAWFPRAACTGLDPVEIDRLFFRSPQSGKLFCRSCPVAAECLEYAIDQGDNDDIGLYGGRTFGERNRIRRQRAERQSDQPGPAKALSREAAEAAHEAARSEGVKAVAARLGVSRMTLYRAWDDYGLGAPIRQPADVCEAAS